MTTPTDPYRRPLYVHRVLERFFADPLVGNGVWPEVKLVPGMFADAPANTLFGRAGTPGQPDFLVADTVINIINTASTAQILAARVVYASLTGAGVVQLTDSVTSSSNTTAATPNSVKTVYDAALLKAGGTMSGALIIGASSSLVFEGATNDDFETTLSVEDPTADRTIRLPNRSGDVVTTGDTGTVTSTMIADGTIVDADVNASAAIAHSKLASMTAGRVLLGSASNVPTSTAVSGDVTISSSGVTAISAGVIVDADVSASAALTHSKLASMTAGTLLLGNASNVPTATAMSGDATISSSGVVSVNTTSLDLFTASAAGIVGGSGGGTSNFLRADGTWSVPPVPPTPPANMLAWGRVQGDGTVTYGSGNFSVNNYDPGKYLITFSPALPTKQYVVLLTPFDGEGDHIMCLRKLNDDDAQTSSQFRVYGRDLEDDIGLQNTSFHFAVFA